MPEPARKGTMRRDDWPTRLQDEIDRGAKRPFRYGRHDCCLAVTRCIKAMTGIETAKPFRGYGNERDAFRTLARHGGVVGIAERVAREQGFEEIAPMKAQRGDIVLLDTPREALGVVDLTGRTVLTAARGGGWRRFAVSDAKRAWRI